MSKMLIDEATVSLVLEALENSADLVEEDYANAVSLYGKYPSRAKRLIGMETMRDEHIKAITVLKELADLPTQQEPFGYFKAEPFGWTDCAETDEGAVALYTTPPAQRKPLTVAEVEQILAQHNYEIHGDRARYIVRMTEAAHGIKENT